jgi:hypothetical protein
MRNGRLFRNLKSPLCRCILGFDLEATTEPESNGKHGFRGRKVMMMTMMIIQLISLFVYLLSSATSVQLQSTRIKTAIRQTHIQNNQITGENVSFKVVHI